jgi:fibronectin-binding autotransporter adhesin
MFALTSTADSYYWDSNGVAVGIGSTVGGNLDWLSNSWATGGSGTLATGPWPNVESGTMHQAVFQGTAGTVSINADVFANALQFETNNYLIDSTGGTLHLVGDDPRIEVNLGGSNQVVTVSSPIAGDSGLTLSGNSLPGSPKFLVLANADADAPNSFNGPLVIEAGGALRLSGGVGNEQIPDDVDLMVSGVIDFNTFGGASDGKREKVRNVTVAGNAASFTVGNESDFVVNSAEATANGTGQGIAINGSDGHALQPHVPGRFIINGWADGAGHLTLENGRVRINTTTSSFGVGGRVLLAGNIYSSGDSQIWNHNGGPVTPEDHVFTNKALDFTSPAHEIHVMNGALSLTSRVAIQPLDVTSTVPGGTTLTKTGAGTLVYEHAIQSSFTGTNRIAEGILRLGANERLANESTVEVAGGTLDLQGFSERIDAFVLEAGSVTGSGAARLISRAFDVRGGTVGVRLSGLANLTKSTSGLVELQAANSYFGDTAIEEGVLRLHAASLSDGADVYLSTGSTLDLSFLGMDVVDSLFVDGVSQLAGTWGSPTSAADHRSSLFAGDGVLQVTTFIAPPLPGDYNVDHVVDAADYTVWRDNLGTTAPLPNDPIGGEIGIAQYDQWRQNFGSTNVGSGSAMPVPEPTAILAAMLGLALSSTGFSRPGRYCSSLPPMVR